MKKLSDEQLLVEKEHRIYEIKESVDRGLLQSARYDIEKLEKINAEIKRRNIEM